MPVTLVLNQEAHPCLRGQGVETTLMADPDKGLIEVYDVIVNSKMWEDDPAVSLTEITAAINQMQPGYTVRINSKGGEVGAALTMYNRMKEHDVTTIVDGYAFSAAGLLAQAAAPGKRFIARGGMFMMHNPHMFPVIACLEDLEQVKSNWTAHMKSVLDIFLEHTTIPEAELTEMMQAETYLSADDAVKKGFFDAKYDGNANLAALNSFRGALPEPVLNMLPPQKPEQLPSPAMLQARRRRSHMRR